MENNEVLKEEVSKLERKLGEVYGGITQDEARTTRHEIAKLMNEIENAIIYNRALPNGMASRLCENVREQVDELMLRGLSSSRQNEYNMTKSNMEYMVSDKEFETKFNEKIEEFKEDGGIHKDNSYSRQVEDVMDRVIKVYREKLEVINSRQSEDAYMDIRHMVTRKKDAFIDMHNEFSDNISKEVKQEIESLGIVMTSTQMKQVEEKAETKTQNMFDTLSQNTKSEEEIAVEDNEKAFRSEPEKKQTKEDLEAMFK